MKGPLDVPPWADDRPPKGGRRRGAIFRATWRAEFERFAARLTGRNIYVTIDLDCLCSGRAVTNWENGRFTLEDLAWALERLWANGAIAGGDICGRYSPPVYAGWKTEFAWGGDHPDLVPPAPEAAQTN